MNSDFATLLQTILWPASAGVFILTGLICLFARKWLFAVSLLFIGLLLGGSWQYNRTHEELSSLHLLLISQKPVKANAAKPEESIYEVSLSGLELGSWVVRLRAKDIRLRKPEQIVLVQFGKRPLTGSYIKSVTNRPEK